MPTSHPFMCYIHQGNVLKGTICSQYTDQAWHEDITHRNITLVFEIAESLAMRYLAFAISTNNYEWTVLHVQDRENNLPVNVMLPDGLSGSVKFGVKLYDAPPSAGSIINVGFDYVITGGVAMSDAGKTITMSCETDGATIRYTLDGSEPTETSLEYTGEFTVEPPVTIKARGYKDGMLAGEVTVKEVEAPPILVPTVGTVLSDGSIVFYDRGEEYGDYQIVEGDIVRLSEGVDDESATSENWRFLICDSANLTPDRPWGPYLMNAGTPYVGFGYGLPNTETLLNRYGTSSSYIWQLVQNRRTATGEKKWFVPSKDELNIVYQNQTAIVSSGGGEFPTDIVYYSSSEYGSTRACSQNFSDGTQDYANKLDACHCRLIRRI